MSTFTARSAFILNHDADAATTIAAHQEGLRVLRGALRRIWIYAISDEPWPPEAQDAIRALKHLAELKYAELHQAGQRELYADIEVDPGDDEQFELVVALSPFTIGAEGWTEPEEQVYGAHDTGTGLWMALTPSEHAELLKQLRTRGADPDAIVPQPR